MHTHVEYSHAPSAVRFMTGAILRGQRKGSLCALLSARWNSCRASQRQLVDFSALTGLNTGSHLPLLLPQVLGFRLNMAVLTHPRFPLPIWNALQIRNDITQHEPMPADADYVVETSSQPPRILPKGLEIDLRTTFESDGKLLWEGVNTFYYRGQFGPAEQRAAGAASPTAPTSEIARWNSPTGGRMAMARLTGDYNGIHLSDAYARAFGFTRAFPHPQLAAAHCMTRLAPADAWPQRLRLWLKGQAPYGAELRLRANLTSQQATFALFYENDARPIMLGVRHS
ncbi:MAG: hypothetical protein KJZ75_11830 [Hyphomonadaceae bacterium]|nr:hypothetical protein [Hyphomonadaceae bacterium]